MISINPIPVSNWPGYNNVKVLRGDLAHPVVTGNKLFKLIPLIKKAKASNSTTLISVGGRYSNHLHALAWAGKEAGFKTVGIVRGFPEQKLTPTLKDCVHWGMDIHFVDFKAYQRRYSESFWAPWLARYAQSFVIFEGGWSKEAIVGSRLWLEHVPNSTDIVICAVGSGSTLAGLASAMPGKVDVIGVPVFKDPDKYNDVITKIQCHIKKDAKFKLWEGFAGKGFGKLSKEQLAFKNTFEHQSGIQLDPVYTAKAFHALDCHLSFDNTLKNKNIVILHTGGIQGNRI